MSIELVLLSQKPAVTWHQSVDIFFIAAGDYNNLSITASDSLLSSNDLQTRKAIVGDREHKGVYILSKPMEIEASTSLSKSISYEWHLQLGIQKIRKYKNSCHAIVVAWKPLNWGGFISLQACRRLIHPSPLQPRGSEVATLHGLTEAYIYIRFYNAWLALYGIHLQELHIKLP
ncbi:hypothetical protein EJ110_NYTH52381 [Nymphaea thermarum]|nr:hypothetical protein EJ110_NYTH52381 [Nymphaea thermarum]